MSDAFLQDKGSQEYFRTITPCILAMLNASYLPVVPSHLLIRDRNSEADDALVQCMMWRAVGRSRSFE